MKRDLDFWWWVLEGKTNFFFFFWLSLQDSLVIKWTYGLQVALSSWKKKKTLIMLVRVNVVKMETST